MNFNNSYAFGTQESLHVLSFGVCCKLGSYVDATSGQRQLNDKGQISHYKNRNILFLLLHTHSAMEPIKNILKIC
jgi:hypothetical protein